MNKSYRLIWNPLRNTWIAVAETARAGGKRSGAVVLTAGFGVALAGMASLTQAAPPLASQLPTGATVVRGDATVTQSGAVMTIGQTTQRAALEWNTFNVGSAAQVNFVQPHASSVTLNRVLDTNPSQIFGRITAPGQVFLTNPNGVYFAPGASVDVGGLVATTHRIGNDDFMAGKTTLDRNGATGSVVNEGILSAKLGGYIALLAPEVRNSGVVLAQKGTVALAAGEVFELQFDANSVLSGIRIEAATLNALVDNRHAVLAPDGLVILSAQAAGQLHNGLVRNSGVVQANGLVADGGRVLLSASHTIQHSGSIQADAATGSAGKGGTVILLASLAQADSSTTVDGSISARGGGQGGNGGFVETSGGRVVFGAQLDIDTRSASIAGASGTWLIDPTDFTIAASGGDLSGSQLNVQLAQNNVTIQSTNGTAGASGNIYVNDAVTWSANTLTLKAQNDITINASMRGSGSASLALEYGQAAVAAGNVSSYTVNAVVDLAAGQHFSTRLGSDGITKNFTVVTDLGGQGSTTGTDLQGMQGNLSGYYALGSNIDASSTSTWNAGAGFAPVGDSTHQFTGQLDGLGHTVSNLAINRPATDNVGLLGVAAYGAEIRHIGLDNASVVGRNNVGALAGSTSNDAVVTNAWSSANVFGNAAVGGLIGVAAYGSVVVHSHSGGDVSGGYATGGLIGLADASTVRNSDSAATVTSSRGNAGGLIGVLRLRSTVSDSHASGTVTTNGTFVVSAMGAGGLIGILDNSDVVRSYATGAVQGDSQVGGLVGYGRNGASISGSRATGSITGGSYLGGLVGYGKQLTIGTSYAIGTVTGSGDYAGGLVGMLINGTVSTSHASGAVTGSRYVGGLVGYGSYQTINTSHANGAVTGNNSVGGLVGGSYGGSINQSYATGALSGTSDVGGLLGTDAAIGYGYGASVAFSHSFYDHSVNPAFSGVGNGADSAGQVLGMTTAEMKSPLNFTSATTANGNVNPNWDLTPSTGTWSQSATVNNGYLSLTGNTYTTAVYLRAIASSSAFGSAPQVSYSYFTDARAGSAVTDANPSGTASWSGAPTALSSVGQYSVTYQGGIMLGNALYALQAGSADTLAVTARSITLTPLDQSRAYGAANPSSGAVAVTSGALTSDTVLGVASLFSLADSSTAAGQTAALIASNQTFTSGWSGNYQITYAPGLLSIVAAAPGTTVAVQPSATVAAPVTLVTAAIPTPLTPASKLAPLPGEAQQSEELTLPEAVAIAVSGMDRQRFSTLEPEAPDIGLAASR